MIENRPSDWVSIKNLWIFNLFIHFEMPNHKPFKYSTIRIHRWHQLFIKFNVAADVCRLNQQGFASPHCCAYLYPYLPHSAPFSETVGQSCQLKRTYEITDRVYLPVFKPPSFVFFYYPFWPKFIPFFSDILYLPTNHSTSLSNLFSSTLFLLPSPTIITSPN